MQLLQPSAKKGLLSLPSQVPISRAFSSPRLLLPTLIRSKLLCMEQRLSEDRHGYVELRTCYMNERPCVAFLPLGSVLRSMLEDSGLAWVSDKVDGPATGWSRQGGLGFWIWLCLFFTVWPCTRHPVSLSLCGRCSAHMGSHNHASHPALQKVLASPPLGS